MPPRRKASAKDSTANLGFEAKLWLAADKLRNNMDAAEYKHVVLGLIFLKYISDTFEEHREKLLAGEGDYAGANPEDPDEYKAENVFWVPADARWSHLQASAKQPTIGKTVDDAMVAIERDNPRLKGVLPKDYARPGLDKHRLGELIDLIGTIDLIGRDASPQASGSGDSADGSASRPYQSKDILGRVYEYFLTRFASAEGKNGGQWSGATWTTIGSPEGWRGGANQFYTPSCVVRCLVEMLAPYKGRIYDPACGSGGMGEVRNQNYEGRKRPQGPHQAVCTANNSPVRKFAEIHGGSGAGQTVASLGNLRRGELPGSPSRTEQSRVHREMRRLAPGAGGICVLAGTARRWRNCASGQAPTAPCRVRRTHRHLRHHHQESSGLCLTDFLPSSFDLQTSPAWVQHFIHHLAPQGMAGFVLANGSMSSNQSGEGDIRKALIEADLVDCMVALPGQLFYSTQIPVCLWFLAKNKAADAKRGFRDRRKETLFIDARKLGTLIDRVHRELTDADLEKISSTYHAWRGDSFTDHRSLIADHSAYADIPGFCKSATTAEIAAHGHVLTPGRYVGAEEVEDDGDPFEEKMPRLVAELHAQFAESAKLEQAIKANLEALSWHK